MSIPIPLEKTTKKSHSRKIKRNPLKKVRSRLYFKAQTQSDKILRKTCSEMVAFLDNEKNFTSLRIKDLLMNMHRSILSLQKKQKKK